MYKNNIVTLLVCSFMAFCFSACSMTNEPANVGNQLPPTEPTLEDEIDFSLFDDELQIAYDDGFGINYLYTKLDESITEGEFRALINQTIQFLNGNENYTWSTTEIEDATNPILRKDAAKLLYEAAKNELQITRLTAEPRHYIDDYYFMENIDPEVEVGEYNSYMVFVSGIASNLNGKRLMECTSDGYFRINDPLTVREALQAVFRLANTNSFYLTDIQNQEARFVSLADTSLTHSDIISTELINKESNLPEASNQSLPYWNGYNLENKLSACNYRYIAEDEIKFLADNGFNAARILYSFSTLTDPDKPGEINLSELEQLDEIINWGLKYDVHIMISVIGIPNQRMSNGRCDWETENIGGKGGAILLEDEPLNELTTSIYTMIAKRYADIPNQKLSFELFAEPTFPYSDSTSDMDNYYTIAIPLIQAIWEISPDRIIIVQDISKDIPIELMKIGCPVSVHDHFYTYEWDEYYDEIGTEIQHEYPIYLPSHIDAAYGDDYATITIEHKDQFDGGIFKMNVLIGNIKVFMDDTIAFEESTNQEDYHWITVDIPAGTKTIRITSEYELYYSAIEIAQTGGVTTSLGMSDMDCGSRKMTQKAAQITIDSDGTVENTPGSTQLNADYLWDSMYKPFADAAELYGVGFTVTEISNVMRTRPQQQEFEVTQMYLDALQSHHVGWFYGALQDVLGQNSTPGADWMMEIYRNDSRTIGLTHGLYNDFTYYPDIIELMKEYME